MGFQYPLELLGSYLYPNPTPTADDSAPNAVTPASPKSTVSRAPSLKSSTRNTTSAGPGNGHFSTAAPSEIGRAGHFSMAAPSEISRAGYFSNSPIPRGEVASRTKVVTTKETEHTVYQTRPPRGPGPHGSRLHVSSDHGPRPTHIQAYTAADIAAGLCANPPPRPSTPGASRQERTKQPAIYAPSLASTAQGDTSSERRERTQKWESYAPSQSSTTQGVLGLGRRPSVGALRRSASPNAPHTVSQRVGTPGGRALPPPPPMVYGGAGEALGRRREPSLPRRSEVNESGRTLKSAMKAVGRGGGGKSVKFAKEKSTRYYHGAGN
ncbi:uncharacterized protein H6S33_010952 [Morchella sextelata]|uniref:uncharacterized protein n=1 Tax=Morchella sextelata TaxID=1174677 RepID=UPI001D0504E8|nr:uncharacterized protein H6S33_010952 [Morchella sextelata]KAH0611687.1 hypothetical protein H6S33_010952 [Morchella sextelata]